MKTKHHLTDTGDGMTDEEFIEERIERLAQRVRCSCMGSDMGPCDRCYDALLNEADYNPRIAS